MTVEGNGNDTTDLNDSGWVDDILARALERARATQPPAAATTPIAEPSILPPPQPLAPRQPLGEPPQRVAAPPEQPLHRPAAPLTTPARVAAPADPPRQSADVRSPQPLFPRDDFATSTSAMPSPRPQQATVDVSAPALAATEPRPSASNIAETSVDDSAENNAIPELHEYTSDPVANRRMRSAIEWTAVVIGALVVAVLIKSFMFQAFYIPSPSMVPTLEVGDRILVNKLSYNLHDINRGDLVVFHKPPNAVGDIADLVKRVIALPGETVEIRDGNLYIDGLRLEEPYLLEPQSSAWTGVIPPGCAAPASDSHCTIPEGFVWVMGDNRTNSTDSRSFGPIDQDLVVGRAFLRVYPFTNIGRL